MRVFPLRGEFKKIGFWNLFNPGSKNIQVNKYIFLLKDLKHPSSSSPSFNYGYIMYLWRCYFTVTTNFNDDTRLRFITYSKVTSKIRVSRIHHHVSNLQVLKCSKIRTPRGHLKREKFSLRLKFSRLGLFLNSLSLTVKTYSPHK